MSDRDYIRDLEFDLPTKLLEELVDVFKAMSAGQLDSEHIAHVDDKQGVYQLFKDDDLVYIGKTDSEAGLQKRLMRHAVKVQGRKGLDTQQVTFKAVRVYVFTAMDLEELLIKHYKDHGQRPAWQHSGFGANDPGRQRDTTRVKPDNFDAMYPIDLEIPVGAAQVGETMSVADLLLHLKKTLPYNIRFQNAGGGRRPHPELFSANIDLGQDPATVLECLQKAKAALGADWQITALPGYVIVYKEKALNKYPSGTIIE